MIIPFRLPGQSHVLSLKNESEIHRAYADASALLLEPIHNAAQFEIPNGYDRL